MFASIILLRALFFERVEPIMSAPHIPSQHTSCKNKCLTTFKHFVYVIPCLSGMLTDTLKHFTVPWHHRQAIRLLSIHKRLRVLYGGLCFCFLSYFTCFVLSLCTNPLPMTITIANSSRRQRIMSSMLPLHESMRTEIDYLQRRRHSQDHISHVLELAYLITTNCWTQNRR